MVVGVDRGEGFAEGGDGKSGGREGSAVLWRR